MQHGSDESLAHPAQYIAAAVGLIGSQLVGTPNPAFETMLRREYGAEIEAITEALIPAVEAGLAGLTEIPLQERRASVPRPAK